MNYFVKSWCVSELQTSELFFCRLKQWVRISLKTGNLWTLNFEPLFSPVWITLITQLFLMKMIQSCSFLIVIDVIMFLIIIACITYTCILVIKKRVDCLVLFLFDFVNYWINIIISTTSFINEYWDVSVRINNYFV
jgi:hypothetical protein